MWLESESSRGTQPFRGIDRWSAAPDLEMQMRAQRGIADANGSDRLALDHTRSLPNRDLVERAVNGIIASAMLENDCIAVRAHRPRVRDSSSGDRFYTCAGGRADSDPVPARSGV